MSAFFDCVVVGGGPAGAVAALTLARRGRRVVLLEKGSLPRFKPCAGGLSSEAFSLLGLSELAGEVGRVHEVRILFDGTLPSLHHLAQPCIMVDRASFDKGLIDLAAAAGAEIAQRTEVTGFTPRGDLWQVETNRGMFPARKVIIADGALGKTAARAGFKKKYGLDGWAMAYEMPQTTPRNEMVVDLGILPYGYTWLFPKGPSLSIGVGVAKKHDDHRKIFDTLALFADRQGVPFDRAQCRGQRIALWGGNQPLTLKDSFLLAGEAAALVDPLNAEGIRPAIKSGMAAGEAVDAALAGDADAFLRYQRNMWTQLGREFAIATRIVRFFFLFPALSYHTALFHPRATSIMNEVFVGSLAYSAITDKVFAVLRKKILGIG
ncbi:MAG TPA: NAD(P)/FAD-dependent oxidoreductase [bacterium]|nr:NAD(P)/FAD-dependent oxidoreductase [bacterium]